MVDPDKEYFRERAEAELGMAQAAGHPAAVRAHYVLAGLYLDRIYRPESADIATPADDRWPGRGRY